MWLQALHTYYPDLWWKHKIEYKASSWTFLFSFGLKNLYLMTEGKSSENQGSSHTKVFWKARNQFTLNI